MTTIESSQIINRADRMLDPEDLMMIYDKHSPGLYRYAYRLLGHSDLAEDCVSESFNRMLKAIKNGGGPKDHIQAYLYRIAHNWITDYYRKSTPVELPLEEANLESDKNLAETVELNILSRQIRSAMTLLTPDQQQVIMLKFIEGWSNHEISISMNKPVGAVKSLQHRAINSLRRTLLPLENSNEREK